MNNSFTPPPFLVVSNPDNSISIAQAQAPTNPFRDRYGAIRRETPGERDIREARRLRLMAMQDFNFSYHLANPFRLPRDIIMQQSIERAQQRVEMERHLQRARDLEGRADTLENPVITVEVESREEEAQNTPLHI